MVTIKTFVVGPIQTNTYLVCDEKNNALVIDPGFPDQGLLDFIEENNLKVKYILITHGHFDHVCFAKKLKEETGAIIAMAEGEVEMIEGSYQWSGKKMGYKLERFEPDEFIKDEDILKVGETRVGVISTPGHSPEGLSFYFKKEKIIFTGDTMFAGNVGRTDLPGSNENILWESIIKKLLTLPDETRVLPGHGMETTIRQEQR